MSHREYGDRDVLDKLGIKPGHVLAFVHEELLDHDLCTRALDRGRRQVGTDELVNVVLIGADSSIDVTRHLSDWRGRIVPDGSIWVLTPKRGLKGYINQTALIPWGLAAGLVDNKVCSVSSSTSAMRFVIRRRDRMRT